MKNDQYIFSVNRNDKAFNYAGSLDQIFKFTAFKDQNLVEEDGVQLTESEGYDFQRECSPLIEILPISDELCASLPISRAEIQVVITIEDSALGIRKVIYELPVASIDSPVQRQIDLEAFEDLSFVRGFTIGCMITRISSTTNDSELLWHKSQILLQKEYIVKSAVADGFFEISWMDFSDDEDKNNILYFIEWLSADVSNAIDTDCFQVKANVQLKDQFKRLENNSNFGHFCIRMVAEQVLAELLTVTLQNAQLADGFEPQKDSLHDKFRALLLKHGEDFERLAKIAQSTIDVECLDANSQVRKVLQKIIRLGSSLENVKFGGYRQ